MVKSFSGMRDDGGGSDGWIAGEERREVRSP